MDKKHISFFFGLIFLTILILSIGVTFGAENDTVNATATIKKPTSVSQADVIKASKSLNSYISKEKKLPNYVTISGFKYSMPEYLYLMSKTISNKKNKVKSAIKVKYDIENPTKPTGTGSIGKIYSVYYYGYANTVINGIDKYKRAPNYVTTAGGNQLQYQSVIFLFSKILGATKSNGELPYYVTVNIRKSTSYNKYLPEYYRNLRNKTLGKTDIGSVQLIGPIGNPASNIKVAYIIGVHPLESNSHNSLYTNLLSKGKNLKYQYFIYKVIVTKQASDYVNGRLNGQLLAQKYVLPHIKANSVNFVIDVHPNQGKNGGNYEKTNFIFAPLNNNVSKSIANTIISKIPGLSYYFPASQTSPHYITNPLVQAGIKTIIYETYLYESKTTTDTFIKKLIDIVDTLKL